MSTRFVPTLATNLVDISTSEGGDLQGVPINTIPDGMIFYPERAFEAAGYETPATWNELIALSEQMVADGHNP